MKKSTRKQRVNGVIPAFFRNFVSNMRTYHEIDRPEFTPEMISGQKPDEVFVFGSNLAGMHGCGIAGFRDK